MHHSIFTVLIIKDTFELVCLDPEAVDAPHVDEVPLPGALLLIAVRTRVPPRSVLRVDTNKKKRILIQPLPFPFSLCASPVIVAKINFNLRLEPSPLPQE